MWSGSTYWSSCCASLTISCCLVKDKCRKQWNSSCYYYCPELHHVCSAHMEDVRITKYSKNRSVCSSVVGACATTAAHGAETTDSSSNSCNQFHGALTTRIKSCGQGLITKTLSLAISHNDLPVSLHVLCCSRSCLLNLRDANADTISVCVIQCIVISEPCVSS